MARKPFLPTFKGQKWLVDGEVAHKRPEMILLIGQCVTLWSAIEHNMAMTLGEMLGSNTEASLAVFASLRNSRAQRDAIMAAGAATLEPHEQELLFASLSALKTGERIRNDLAHGQWGILGEGDGEKGMLTWIEDKHSAPWKTAQWVAGHQQHKRPPRSAFEEHLFVYTEEDLKEALETLRDIHRISIHVVWWLNPFDHMPRRQLFDALSKMPLVRQALDRLSEQKSKSSEQPQPRDAPPPPEEPVA